MEELIFAGFGGQGVLAIGSLVAYAGLDDGKHVSWLPSYGPEQRGGTANVAVVISDEPIGSPMVTEPTIAVVFNDPSYEKFESTVCSGGNLFGNTSLVSKNSERSDISFYGIEATKKAQLLGNIKCTNMILLGALVQVTSVVSSESVINSLKKFSEKKPELLEINLRAFEMGREYFR